MKSGTDTSKLPNSANGARPAPSLDDRNEVTEPVLPARKPKSGLFPTGLSRAIVLAALLGCATWGSVQFVVGRYDLVASSNVENNYVYRIDRVSGAVSLCSSLGCTVVPDRAPPK
ncbi:MAG: hypothetical protein KDE14_06455 [Rhodobacteraceae bacterium]|nr:hypothetical protein [Paracoccaceae bacterium]